MRNPLRKAYKRLIPREFALAELSLWGFDPELLSELGSFADSLPMVQTWDATLQDYFPDQTEKAGLSMSRFANPGEGLIFSSLIEQALAQSGSQVTDLIDLGCGSSFPSLRILTLSDARAQALQLHGVDIDPEAASVSRSNANALGLGKRASFQCESVDAFVKGRRFGRGDLVVANLPYIPAPVLQDPFFLPVDGGEHGLKHIREVIQAPFDIGARLVLLASSLSSPRHLLTVLKERGFELLALEGALTRFGRYLKDPRLAPYLEERARLGDCSFGTDSEGERFYITLGLILVKGRE